MMRALLAALALAVGTPAAAEDRYSGFYTAPCGSFQCDLRIEPQPPKTEPRQSHTIFHHVDGHDLQVSVRPTATDERVALDAFSAFTLSLDNL